MAKKPQQNPADLAKAAGQLAELKARLFFLIGALIVFRIGTFIPVPGVNPSALADFFNQQSGNLLGLFNMFRRDADSASRSNRLMRLRVLLQFIAVVLVMVLFYIISQNSAG